MTRTNIDLDDEALAAVMRRYDIATKREAVNFALRRVAGPEMTTEALLALRGTGWSGDLDEIRDNPVEGYEVSPRVLREIEQLTSEPRE